MRRCCCFRRAAKGGAPVEHNLQKREKRKKSLAQRVKNNYKLLFQDAPAQYDDWERKRSWLRFVDALNPWLTLRVFGGLLVPLVFNFAICIVIWQTHDRWLPDDTDIAFPFSLTLFALSLLLVFKTNSSYNRWWEGRRLWGAMYNEIRDFNRQLYALSRHVSHHKERMCLSRWSVALPYLANAFLDPRKPLRPQLNDILQPHEIDWVQGTEHYPMACAQMMSQVLADIELPEYSQLRLERHIGGFINNVGGCERIQRQSIPSAYSRHTARFLILWVQLLPIALWPHIGRGTLAVGPLVAFMLLGLENIGAQIENPFLVLPLDSMCATMHRNVVQLVRAHSRVGAGLEQSAVGTVVAKSLRDPKCDNPPPLSSPDGQFRKFSGAGEAPAPMPESNGMHISAAIL